MSAEIKRWYFDIETKTVTGSFDTKGCHITVYSIIDGIFFLLICLTNPTLLFHNNP
jgi:hypothetical protein